MSSEETVRIDIDPPEEVGSRIARAKNELEEMIDLNPQVIMLLDRHGRILRTNRATLDFFGIPDFSQILHKELTGIGYQFKIHAVMNLPQVTIIKQCILQ